MSGSTNQVDLDKVSSVEARRLMSEEHKNLGYRPPPESLASKAQAAAAKHDTGNLAKHDIGTLREAAKEDAEGIMRARVGSDRGLEREGINLGKLTEGETRKLMSEEHKELGYRPPPGSLAAEAQSYMKRKSQPVERDYERIRDAAIKDAHRIQQERNPEGCMDD